jgi:hypothetical protein
MDEVKLMKVICLANLVTLLVCILVYLNFKLLGEFFFIYFMSLMTSVSLRNSKQRISDWIEFRFKYPGRAVQSSLFYKLGSLFYKACKSNSFLGFAG